MHLIFVSSTTVGGSGRSQRELAEVLCRTGHRVTFVVDDGSAAPLTRWLYGHLSDLAARIGDRPGGRLARVAEGRPGRRPRFVAVDELDHLASPVPQNALAGVLTRERPDVVVGSSLERLAWRRIHRACRSHGIPTVLYIREEESTNHMSLGETPDALIANAASLQHAMQARGFECSFIPSLINVERTRTPTSRRCALAVNPIPSRGVDIVWQIARERPHLPIVLQESWPLSEGDRADLERRAKAHPGVEFRRAVPPSPALYADARVLLVPYRVDNRPRVIAEAQANGIPILAADLPALREAVGAGGLLVPPDDVAGWSRALDRLWNDSALYAELSAAAERHSQRDELNPTVVARSFLAVVQEVAARRPAALQDPRQPEPGQ